MKTHRVYIEVRKSENEVVCLEPKDEGKILEASAILDAINAELGLGLSINLRLELPNDRKRAVRLIGKWNRLLNASCAKPERTSRFRPTQSVRR